MAEDIKKVQVNIEGKDNTGKAFQSAKKNADLFSGSVNGINKAFSLLSVATLGYFTGTKILEQLSLGAKGFQEEANIISLTNERLKSAGIALDDANPKIQEFVDSLENMGMSGEQARDAVGKLATKTRDLDEALRLTKMASDLSASGFGTIDENVSRLSKVLTGNGSRALLEYGIKMEGTHSKAEQLNAIQTKITRTTEEFGNTTQGRLQTAKENWEDFRKELGGVLTFFQNEFVVAFNSFDAGGKFAKSLTKIISDMMFGLTNLGDLVAERVDSIFGLGINDSEKFYEKLTKYNEDFEKKWKDISGEITTPVSQGGDNPFPDLSNDAEESAEKIKSSFTEVAKKLVGTFNEQTKAISELRQELKDLETDTQKQLATAEQSYQEDLKNRARDAQEKVAQIEKEIKETQEARGQGWRTRVAELEAEKEKEKSIIARIGGEVSDLNTELAKDDLQLLKEKYEAERSEIQAEADKTKLEKESEISGRTGTQLRSVIASLSPALLDTLTAENQSFLGQIGAGASQYIFNFNGDVNDKDKLIAVITEALNRQATLKGIAGK